MAVTLDSISISLNLNATYKSAENLLTATAPLAFSFSDTMTSGTGKDNADLLFADKRTVSSGSPDDLDLSGVLTDIYGNTLANARIKCMAIKNLSTTAAEILDVGGDLNGLVNWISGTNLLRVHPEGAFVLWAPSATAYAVTAATADILQIAAQAGSITYEIALLGASA